MKNLKLMLVIATAAVTAISCGTKNENKEESTEKEAPKVLVLYYSQTSNTKAVATEIATKLNADIEEIVAVNPYDGDFQATIDRCIVEREQGTVTESNHLLPMSQNTM